MRLADPDVPVLAQFLNYLESANLRPAGVM
jgi:hypothetical protein